MAFRYEILKMGAIGGSDAQMNAVLHSKKEYKTTSVSSPTRISEATMIESTSFVIARTSDIQTILET